MTRVARPGEVVARLGESLEEALERVRTVAAAFGDRLRDLPRQPQTVELQFGLNLHAGAGVVVARTEAGASFTVRIVWDQTTATDLVQDGAD
ncbi:CU044_2847 family protein [Streptomyces luteireticuli]|uniref:CU044_2847 family protein n=1 Tax=Streptomyces luteireticuli TaxID=173858 RepID=UPI003556B747